MKEKINDKRMVRETFKRETSNLSQSLSLPQKRPQNFNRVWDEYAYGSFEEFGRWK